MSHPKVPAIILHQGENTAQSRNLLAAQSQSLLAARTCRMTHHRGLLEAHERSEERLQFLEKEPKSRPSTEQSHAKRSSMN